MRKSRLTRSWEKRTIDIGNIKIIKRKSLGFCKGCWNLRNGRATLRYYLITTIVGDIGRQAEELVLWKDTTIIVE